MAIIGNRAHILNEECWCDPDVSPAGDLTSITHTDGTVQLVAEDDMELD